MRVISGISKGCRLDGINIEGIRPTMDRVKESLFAIINPNLDNSIILDLFAGSGSLGIEALSNGARICYFVDYNKKAIDIINKNLNKCHLDDKSIVLKNDFIEALNYFKNKSIKFDLIFLDPPYKLHLINNAIELILKNKLLNNNGIIICEGEDEIINTKLSLIKHKKYGCKNISIYKLDSF